MLKFPSLTPNALPQSAGMTEEVWEQCFREISPVMLTFLEFTKHFDVEPSPLPMLAGMAEDMSS